MKFELDEYAYLHSLLHRWHPKYKLIGLFALIFAFAFVEDLRLLPAMLGVTAILYKMSGLPILFLSNRLAYPGFFLLGVVVLLPFLSGETVLWQWGWLTLRQEGILAMTLVVGRFLSILTLSLILIGTTPFITTVKAMRSLGLPLILADMMLLSYRYLFEIAANLTQMQQAMRLRGFQNRAKHWRRIVALTGTLLVVSYEQSERIYKAMQLRGYGNTQVRIQFESYDSPWNRIGLVVTILTAVCFVVAFRF